MLGCHDKIMFSRFCVYILIPQCSVRSICSGHHVCCMGLCQNDHGLVSVGSHWAYNSLTTGFQSVSQVSNSLFSKLFMSLI